jgi:hypothetical protein
MLFSNGTKGFERNCVTRRRLYCAFDSMTFCTCFGPHFMVVQCTRSCNVLEHLATWDGQVSSLSIISRAEVGKLPRSSCWVNYTPGLRSAQLHWLSGGRLCACSRQNLGSTPACCIFAGIQPILVLHSQARVVVMKLGYRLAHYPMDADPHVAITPGRATDNSAVLLIRGLRTQIATKGPQRWIALDLAWQGRVWSLPLQ